MRDFLKDVLATVIAFLQRHDSWEKTMETTRKVLALAPKTARLIAAMAAQALLSERKDYKRIRHGDNVEGVWYGVGMRSTSSSPRATAGKEGPVILYIHGGAFTIGSAKMWSTSFTTLVRSHKKKYNKDLRIFSIVYDLSPEAAYPRQLDQIAVAYDYLVRTCGVSPSRLVVSGDSAGANLAMATIGRMQNAKAFNAALLISPWTHPSESLVLDGHVKPPPGVESKLPDDHTWELNAKTDYVVLPFGSQGIQSYLGFGKKISYADSLTNELINPGLVSEQDMKRTYPDQVMVVYGKKERLCSNIEQTTRKIQNAIKDVTVYAGADGCHDWVLKASYNKDRRHYLEGLEAISAWLEKIMIHSS